MPSTETTNTAPPAWNKYVPDIILLLLYFFCLDPLMQWQQQHLLASCRLLMMLNIMAVALGCYSFFTAFADTDALQRYRNSLTAFEAAVMGLSAFISSMAFLWWLVPFAAVKKMGVQETGFIAGAVMYFIVYMGIVAGSVQRNKQTVIINTTLLKTVNSVVVTVFFFFSYAFLTLTLQQWKPGFIAAPYLAIICMFVFYLPLRFFLLLRPPFHKLEYLGFIICFGFLLLQLFMHL